VPAKETWGVLHIDEENSSTSLSTRDFLDYTYIDSAEAAGFFMGYGSRRKQHY